MQCVSSFIYLLHFSFLAISKSILIIIHYKCEDANIHLVFPPTFPAGIAEKTATFLFVYLTWQLWGSLFHFTNYRTSYPLIK